MAERSTDTGAKRWETASLLAHALMTRIAASVRQSATLRLRPTVFVPLRRGEDPSWKDVVARSV